MKKIVREELEKEETTKEEFVVEEQTSFKLGQDFYGSVRRGLRRKKTDTPLVVRQEFLPPPAPFFDEHIDVGIYMPWVNTDNTVYKNTSPKRRWSGYAHYPWKFPSEPVRAIIVDDENRPWLRTKDVIEITNVRHADVIYYIKTGRIRVITTPFGYLCHPGDVERFQKHMEHRRKMRQVISLVSSE